jgi:hypothetical protein
VTIGLRQTWITTRSTTLVDVELPPRVNWKLTVALLA